MNWNRKKDYDWFQKHKIKCDKFKDQYLECLLTVKKETPCKSKLNQLLLNHCFIYNDIQLQLVK